MHIFKKTVIAAFLGATVSTIPAYANPEILLPMVSVCEIEENTQKAPHDICHYRYVLEDMTPVYTALNSDVEAAFYFNKGDRLFAAGDNGNGFYTIIFEDEPFYIRADDVYDLTTELFIDTGMMRFLNEEVNILNFSTEATPYLAENVSLNTELMVTGEYDRFYRVEYKGKTGYIEKEFCSETLIEPKVSEIQLEIARRAKEDEGKFPCEAGYCAAWTSGIYHAAGLYGENLYVNAIDYWNKWGNNDGVTSSTRSDNIPIGAIVVGSGTGKGENPYGHVGIYIGDGYVAENVGKHKITSLEDWIKKNRGICEGHQGYIGWVFPYNIDLQDY